MAAHLAAMGWDSSLCTAVGPDDDGALLAAAVGRHGVNGSLVERNLLPTGSVTIELADDGHTFDIATPAAWDAITGPVRLPPHDVFYYGCLGGRDRRSRSALQRLLRESGARWKVCDVNLRPPYTPNPLVVELLAHATVVKVARDEAETLGCDRPEDLLRIAPLAQYAVVTHGPEGASMTHRSGSRWTVPVSRVEVMDSVGAGDAFTAGLIDGLARGKRPIEALLAARDRAADTLQQRGGLP